MMSKLEKRSLKRILTLLHVQPCYLINAYHMKVVSPELFYECIKSLYSNCFNNERVLYLMLSLFQGMLETETSSEPLLDDDSVLSKVFK